MEKKRGILIQEEKLVVSKHEVGHAVVGTAVAKLISSMPPVQKLSIVPRYCNNHVSSHHKRNYINAVIYMYETLFESEWKLSYKKQECIQSTSINF